MGPKAARDVRRSGAVNVRRSGAVNDRRSRAVHRSANPRPVWLDEARLLKTEQPPSRTQVAEATRFLLGCDSEALQQTLHLLMVYAPNLMLYVSGSFSKTCKREAKVARRKLATGNSAPAMPNGICRADVMPRI